MVYTIRKICILVVILLVGIGFAFLFRSNSVRAQAESSQQNRIEIDSSTALPIYANYARVTGTADEAIIDFGVFAGSQDEPVRPIKINQQVVMNYYTLKRITLSLQATLDRHEKTFGPIELDIEKRTIK